MTGKLTAVTRFVVKCTFCFPFCSSGFQLLLLWLLFLLLLKPFCPTRNYYMKLCVLLFILLFMPLLPFSYSYSEMEKAADAVDAVHANFFYRCANFFYRCANFCFFHAFFKVVCLFCAIFGIFAHF